jgi:hypothetical protein
MKKATTPAPSFGSAWAGVHLQFYQTGLDMKNVILLDNQSTTDIFCNPNLVEDIHETEETLTLATNGGTLVTNLKANVPSYGTVWYHPDALTNIFSFANMAKKHEISYDHAKGSFTVHVHNKNAEFKRDSRGLYCFKPSYSTKMADNINSHGYQFNLQQKAAMDSVEENKMLFTNKQIDQAKKARQLYNTLGTPSIKDFKAIITMNAIKNLPVTIEDINLAEKIFGPDIGALKGKTTRQKPTPVINDYIEIPEELINNHQKVTLCMDGMKINGIPFLTTVSRHIMYRTAQWLPNQTSKAYRSALGTIISIYNRAGFSVKTIHCDNEFQPLVQPLSHDYNIGINYANPQEHVPEAERNIRVIKERFRAAFHRLPFSKLPKVMIKFLAMESAKKLNFFPPKGGISPFYSPRMILHQENLDYNKHCSIPFGTYVQAHHEPTPTNTQHPRTLDCIYLRYNDNKQGGHELLDLRTGRTIKRRTVTPLPMTQNVIELVHEMATSEGMPDGLKIQTRSGIILYDSSCLAGVDYTDSDNEENENVEENSTEPSSDDEEESQQSRDEMDPNNIGEIIQEQPKFHEAEEENNNLLDVNEEDNNSHDSNPTGVQTINENIATEVEETEEPWAAPMTTTRSGRMVRAPTKLNLHQCHLQTQAIQPEEYSIDTAKVIAKHMCELNTIVLNGGHKHHSFVETYSLKKGLQKFGEKGHDAAFGEMKQLHDRQAFKPVNISTLSQEEKRRALDSLIFLVEKRDGRVKARTCANGSTQRVYMSKEEAASPTVLTESILLTATIEAKEGRDVMTVDIPNAFIQTDIESTKSERVIMKIKGALVDMLVQLDAAIYKDYVILEGNNKVLYVEVLKAIYGMLQSSLLFYKKLRKDLLEIGFIVNPYDPCVAN